MINVDGSGLRRLAHRADSLDWSPDGTRLAFSREVGRSEKTVLSDVYVINADDFSATERCSLRMVTLPSGRLTATALSSRDKYRSGRR